ncbi:predicted protein [Lichtheimia corymbifera JMRC:FSU:9682]|uniref:Uncharacterized protein n=1 Tax=Lichtheimia corymbifera JMRC:FSU:9682 TaxID=1263082 RepID=A0A068S815_9FUNG|nr:predicted protein [Lichtheimia corymbifera JMRC:FSU:9682]
MKFSLITTTLCFALLIAIAQAACDCAPSNTTCLADCVTSANDCIQNCRDNSECYTNCIDTHWPTSAPSSALPTAASSSAVPSASSMASMSASSASASESATATPTPNSASSSVPRSMIPLFIVFLILPLL